MNRNRDPKPHPDQAPYTDETWPVGEGEHAVSELASEWQGALSPFGAEQVLPLPPESLNYEHPTREELPNH